MVEFADEEVVDELRLFLKGVVHVLTLTPTRDFSFLVSSEREGSKNGGSPWIRTEGLSHHSALSIPGTPLGCRYPGSDSVPICHMIPASMT